MKFQYKAVDIKGNIKEGELEAKDKPHAISQLEEQKLTPLIVKKKSHFNFSLSLSFSFLKKKIPPKDVIIFTQSLASLIDAGLSLDRALEITRDVLKESPMKVVVEEIIEDIKGGSSFASSLHSHKDIFSDLYISMIRAAESAGVMGTVLDGLASYLTRSYEFRSSLISSMIYPLMLFCVSILSLAVLIIFVVPKFLNMFISMDISPPLPILIASKLGLLIKNFWWIIVMAVLIGSYYFKHRLKQQDGKLWLDKKLLKLPFIGNLLLKIENARFARTLSTLLENGVSILQSITITREIISNEVLKSYVELIYIGVREGEKLIHLFSRQKTYWHPALISLAGIGEETGRLPQMLLKCAQMLERDVEEDLKKIISMAEPATIIIMGLVIGSLIVSMLSAIFSINETVF